MYTKEEYQRNRENEFYRSKCPNMHKPGDTCYCSGECQKGETAERNGIDSNDFLSDLY